MNKEVLVGDRNDDNVAKGVDALTIVTLLQTILAMMLLCVKSLSEQSLLIARYSKLSKPTVSIPFQPVTSLPSPQCSCLTESRMCCRVITAITRKVASMAHIASAGMVWYRQVCGAINCMKVNMILSLNGLIMSEDLVKRLADELKMKS